MYAKAVKPTFRVGNNDSPLVAKVSDLKPNLLVGKTNAQVYDQGYTYNEAGFTYNEAGVAYGGIYENDVYPLISSVKIVKPSIVLWGDMAGTATPINQNSGMLVGMLGMTYP